MDKAIEQLYHERLKRVEDAIQLKVPDRIPTVINVSYFPAKYAGVTCADAFYKPEIWKKAIIKTIAELEPDGCNLTGATSGNALDSLDFKQMLWPGRQGASPNHTFQFVEGEYMKADEYGAFLEDPTDYLIRTYLPRISGALESFKNLPPMSLLALGPTTILGLPGLDTTVAALSKARHELLKYNAEMRTIDSELKTLGFPVLFKAVTYAPFDMISDRLRGMRGSMLDMYRQPANLLKTCEKLLPIVLNDAIARARVTGFHIVFIPLHRGAEGFMSIKQFETFYWPTLKALLLGLVDADLTPMPFFEGDYTSRLDYLRELPGGKIVGHFDSSDIRKVKEVVGDIMCIMGNVPPSLLQTGTQQDVKDYCKKLIDEVSSGGGFILAPRSAIDEAKPENIKVMIDFTREHGVYK